MAPATAPEELAVVSDLQLQPGQQGADRAELDLVDRVAGRNTAGVRELIASRIADPLSTDEARARSTSTRALSAASSPPRASPTAT